MTKEKLKQFAYLRKEVIDAQNRLAEIESRATSATHYITGMPTADVSKDKLAHFSAQITEQKRHITKILSEALNLQNDIFAFVSSIDDSFIRQIITHRYIDCYSWVKVAVKIGGGNTSDSVRVAHDRFLKVHNIF